MQKQSVSVALYAILVLVGGIMGYVKVHSLVSLVAGGSTAFILLICSYLMQKGNTYARYTVIGIITCLLVFFSYRFFTSFKFMPGGLMTICSAFMIYYLTPYRTLAFQRINK